MTSPQAHYSSHLQYIVTFFWLYWASMTSYRKSRESREEPVDKSAYATLRALANVVTTLLVLQELYNGQKQMSNT